MTDFRFVSKRMLFLSLGYFLTIMIISIIVASRNIGHSLFDLVINLRGGGSADVFTLLTGILPLFAFMIPLVIDRSESEMMVLRVGQKEKLFYRHFLFSVVISAFFTLFMAVGGIVGSVLANGHVQNLWDTEEGTIYFLLDNKAYFPLYVPHVSSVSIWAYVLSSRFLALLFIATCVIALKSILKKIFMCFLRR